MSSDELKQKAQDRDKSIRSAVVTALMSKVGTMLLRIISLPIAINVLNKEIFGVYATVVIVVQMMDVLHIGIGPSLTHKLSKAQLENNKDKEARLFSTSVIISGLITLVIAAIAWMLVVYVPISQLFGENYAVHSELMKRICFIAIALIAIELIAFVGERARDGYMETRYTNSWGAAGNFSAAILLIVGMKFYPSAEVLILSINGSIIAAKVGNMIHMLYQRPYLIPKLSTFSANFIKPLLAGAGVFSVVYGLSCITEYNAVAYLVGRFLGPGEAANYSILVTCHMSLAGMLAMVTVPLWPALIDAWGRQDYNWIKQTCKKMTIMSTAYGVAVFLGMVLLGKWAFNLWIGDQFDLSYKAVCFFGLYFALFTWRGINAIFCLGLDKQKVVMYVVLAESFVVALVTSLVLRSGYSIAEVLIGLCVCLACFSGWIYPLLYRRTMANAENSIKSRSDHQPSIDRSIENGKRVDLA